MKPRILALSLLLCLIAALPSLADGLIIIAEPPQPLPNQPHVFAPLHVKHHHVRVTIENRVATTTVEQVFHNPSDMRLEGTYLFPVPQGAAIDRFTMDIDGQEMEAELLDAEKARQIYEDIVRKSRDPALLEYSGQGLFRARIFPIEPRSDKRITLKYTQILKRDGKLTEYLYPLNTEKFSSQPIESLSVKVELDSDQPLTTIYSPTHEVEIDRQGEKKAVIGFESANVRPDTDFRLFYAVEKAEIGLNVLAYHPESVRDSDGFVMLLLSPGTLAESGQFIPKDIVFVLDTSGSMSGGKLEQAKKALAFCVENLNEGDRFEVVRFSTEAEPLFAQLRDANAENRKLATQFVEDLKPIGATAIDDALRTALKSFTEGDGNRPALVIFLTDGQPTSGETNEDTIVKNVTDRAAKARVFCFGVGTDVNTHLLDKITEKTRAYSQYVLPDEDLEVKLSSFYGRIDAPVLADLKLKTEGGPRLSKMQPMELPDLFEGNQLVVLARYSGDGAATITLEGDVNGEKRTFTYETVLPARGKATEHTFIPRLWASRRVGYLLEQIRLHGENAELKQEVTELARAYGIVTPYTSYLILEDEQRRNVPLPQQTLSELKRDDVANDELERSYFSLREDRAGDVAVRGSRALEGYKQADSLSSMGRASTEAAAPLAATSPAPGMENQGAARVVQQEARFIRGRTFYRNGDAWTDAALQSRTDAKVVEVAFGSDDYFALLRKHPDMAAWLSIGTDVRVVLDDTVYHVK